MNRETRLAITWACLLCMFAFVVSGCHRQSPSAGRYSGTGQPVSQTSSSFRPSASSDFPAGRPVDFQAFKDRYQTVGVSPEGAVRMYFDAVYTYMEPAKRAEGAKMLRYSLHERQGWEKFPNRVTFISRLNDPSYQHIFRSFAEGTSPENSYAMNPDNYRLMFERFRQEGTDFGTVTIRSSGADSSKLVGVKQFEDGLWYVTGNSSTYVEVRKPANQVRRGSHDADLD